MSNFSTSVQHQNARTEEDKAEERRQDSRGSGPRLPAGQRRTVEGQGAVQHDQAEEERESGEYRRHLHTPRAPKMRNDAQMETWLTIEK